MHFRSFLIFCDVLVVTLNRLCKFIDPFYFQRKKFEEGMLKRNIKDAKSPYPEYCRERNQFDFSMCRYVVLDEIDVLTECSFLLDVKKILEVVNVDSLKEAVVQKLMLIATKTDKSCWGLFEDVLRKGYTSLTAVDVHGVISNANKDVMQEIREFNERTERRAILLEILLDELLDDEPDENYIFTFWRMHQDEREAIMNKFKNGAFRFLVSTFVASRGLDIEGVDHVINFELPETSQEYIHRIGRSGRAGNIGHATSFVDMKKDRDLYLVKLLAKNGCLWPIPTWLEEKLKEDNNQTWDLP